MSSTQAYCRHFGLCGGCVFQDMPSEPYYVLKRKLIVDALTREGLAHLSVADVADVAPGTRRRATFKAEKKNGRTLVGFHAVQSHAIADMFECRVLTPALVGLVPRLREMFGWRLKDDETAEAYAVECDNGLDVSLRGVRADAKTIRWAADWARRAGLIRLTAAGDLVVQYAQPTVMFGRVGVCVPPGAFLQPTREGEVLLAGHVLSSLGRSRRVADLFCGVGTFALRAAEVAQVLAIDSDRSALEALAAGARGAQKLKPVEVRPRDLMRLPLGASELDGFDAVILDPPRAGAARQCEELARSKVPKLIYVSCNPLSFARDTRILYGGGWRAARVIPVDQFLWSSHIELVASFSKA